MRGRPRSARLLWPVALAPLIWGCAVEITPDRVRVAAVPTELRTQALDRWEKALEVANSFLASGWSETMPAGSIRLDPARGMRFVSPRAARPIRVRCTIGGDLVLLAGFDAQERSDGFVVGPAAVLRGKSHPIRILALRGPGKR